MTRPVQQNQRIVGAVLMAVLFTCIGPLIGWLAALPILMAMAGPSIVGLLLQLVAPAVLIGAAPAALTGLIFGLAPRRWQSPFFAAGIGALVSPPVCIMIMELRYGGSSHDLAVLGLLAWCGAFAGFLCAKVVRRDKLEGRVTPPTPAPPPPSPQTTP